MKQFWNWKNYQIAWQIEETSNETGIAIVLIHGFGACKEHWRFNQKTISSIAPVSYTHLTLPTIYSV